MSLDVLQRFPEGRSLAEDLGRWLIVVVRSRQEKTLARDLAAAGIPYYLPLACKVHRRPDNGWRKKAVVPLFPGYVAVASLECKPFLYETGRVKQFLTVLDQRRFTRELETVEKALSSGLPVELHPSIPLGSLVEIAHGPMKGVTGRLERVGKHWYLVSCVDLFQQCVRVKLPGHDVKLHGQPLHSLHPLPLSHNAPSRP